MNISFVCNEELKGARKAIHFDTWQPTKVPTAAVRM